MIDFKKDQTVWHDSYGLGQVVNVFGKQVLINFDASKEALFNMENMAHEFRLSESGDDIKQQMLLEDLNRKAYQEENQFWLPHPNEDWQVQGSHLAIYDHGEDNRFMHILEPFIQNATNQLLDEQARDFASPLGMFENGWLLGGWFPGSNDEEKNDFPHLMAVIGQSNEANEFVSLYPYFLSEALFDFTLDEVLIWENGLEANLIGEIDERPVAFFDNRFVTNRHEYQKGKTYQFSLQAHAYKMKYDTEPLTQTIEVDDDRAQAMAALNGTSIEREKSMTIDMSSMLIGLSIHEGQDDYLYRGEVKEVISMSYNNLPAYQVYVEVWVDSDPVPILVSEDNWEESQPPKAGDRVAGQLWLTGETL